MLQTRKIKAKDSEIQAVPLERKKNPNKASLDEHTPNFCAGSPPEQANPFSIGCQYAKADKAPEQ